MDIPKNYDKNREPEIYAKWLENGYFRAEVNPNKTPYTIMMPPPNITGQLHIGHALNNTIQDILVRFKRMQGYETLYQPGTDHAAIATEVRVIKALAKEGLTKEGLGREAFLEKLWDWNAKYGGTIIKQLEKLGVSCDWQRLRFTMDEGLSDAVLEVFVRLYEEGKIYKGERLVNWCTICGTSISDAEVEHEEKEGYLYHFKYPIKGESDGFISFATTRPETMLGDTAIAVHPDDERYKNLVGKMVIIPIVGREIPIIADTYVDPEYGTGVVKITPAHDPNDFEVGVRHNLPRINVMNDDGTINENGKHYNGLTCEKARVTIIDEMTKLGLYIKSESMLHNVGEHDRCGTVVEPLMKLQWFVSMEELAKPALEAYKNGKVKFNFERFGRIYQHWLENIRDWCISRQLWWGHRIPAYYCLEGHITVSKTTPQKCSSCDATELIQDEDVLDTWFSSALWPFSTLGWPEITEDLKYFYPTNTLVTNYEILFTWVVRMVFMGIKYTDDVPYTDVIIHGMVRDELGRKMSKSLDNGIDPLEIIEEFGADALRLMLVSGNALDNDTRFFHNRLEPARNTLNKLWNATRFVMMNIEDYDENISKSYRTEDKWILSKMARCVKEVTEKLESHDLVLATQKIVEFLWDEFCDWYVEMVKPRLYATDSESGKCLRVAAQETLRKVLITALKLLHPVAPFITEDLYCALNSNNKQTIMLSEWPEISSSLINESAEKDIELLKEIVRAIRNIRAEKKVPPSQKISIALKPENAHIATLVCDSSRFIKVLVGANDFKILPSSGDGEIPINALSIVVSSATVYIPLDSLVDPEKEKARLLKEQTKLEQEVSRIRDKLSNEGFVSKAPEKLIIAEKDKLENYSAMLAKVNNELVGL